MPRFFFDHINGAGHVVDNEGLEFATLADAQLAAAHALAGMLRDDAAKAPSIELVCIIRDGDQQTVSRLTASLRTEGT